MLRSAINLWHNIEYILIYVSICDVLIIIFLAVFFLRTAAPLWLFLRHLCGQFSVRFPTRCSGLSLDSLLTPLLWYRKGKKEEIQRRRPLSHKQRLAMPSRQPNTRHVCPDDVAVESGSIFRGSTVGGCSLVNWALDCQPSCT